VTIQQPSLSMAPKHNWQQPFSMGTVD
jgi:hypothetical protein